MKCPPHCPEEAFHLFFEDGNGKKVRLRRLKSTLQFGFMHVCEGTFVSQAI